MYAIAFDPVSAVSIMSRCSKHDLPSVQHRVAGKLGEEVVKHSEHQNSTPNATVGWVVKRVFESASEIFELQVGEDDSERHGRGSCHESDTRQSDHCCTYLRLSR
jgi:hypothetical protein